MSGILLSFVTTKIPVVYTIDAASGSFAYTGQDATLSVVITVVAVGTFSGSAIMNEGFGG